MSVCVENNLWDQAKTDIANMFAYLGVAVTIASLAGGGPIVAGVGIAVSLTGFAAGFIIDYTSPPVQYYECGEVIGLTADDENRIAEDFYLQAKPSELNNWPTQGTISYSISKILLMKITP